MALNYVHSVQHLDIRREICMILLSRAQIRGENYESQNTSKITKSFATVTSRGEKTLLVYLVTKAIGVYRSPFSSRETLDAKKLIDLED